MCIYSRALPCSVLVRALSTGRPHTLSANGGVLRLEASQYPSSGCSKHEISGDFLGMTTWRGDKWDDRLLIWNWKTGVLHVNMVRATSAKPHREPTDSAKLDLAVNPSWELFRSRVYFPRRSPLRDSFCPI